MDKIALILTIIGGLNWGSIGIFRFDLVAWLFGGQTATVSRVVYTLVGLAAIWCISLLFGERAPDEGVKKGQKMPAQRRRHFLLAPCLRPPSFSRGAGQ